MEYDSDELVVGQGASSAGAALALTGITSEDRTSTSMPRDIQGAFVLDNPRFPLPALREKIETKEKRIARAILISLVTTTTILILLFLSGLISIGPATGSTNTNRELVPSASILASFAELPVAPKQVIDRWVEGLSETDHPEYVYVRLCVDEGLVWTVGGYPRVGDLAYYDDSGALLGIRHYYDYRESWTEGDPPNPDSDKCIPLKMPTQPEAITEAALR